MEVFYTRSFGAKIQTGKALAKAHGPILELLWGGKVAMLRRRAELQC